MTATPAEFKCEFCSKEFRRASTGMHHLCEPKRRHQQRTEPGVVIALQAFNAFMRTMHRVAKDKSYEDFCQSPYYSAFVRFGQYIVSINAVNALAFINWIIASGKPLDKWTKDENYDRYLYEYIRSESPSDALERSIKEMNKWADENDSAFNHFFKYVNENKACQLINNGRISPWVIYNCASGVEFLERLNPLQLEMVYTIIEPAWWMEKFSKEKNDVAWVKSMLSAASL